jgi:hypothetical protein
LQLCQPNNPIHQVVMIYGHALETICITLKPGCLSNRLQVKNPLTMTEKILAKHSDNKLVRGGGGGAAAAAAAGRASQMAHWARLMDISAGLQARHQALLLLCFAAMCVSQWYLANHHACAGSKLALTRCW